MSDEQQAAFLIDGIVYPVPTSFRLADPVLIREITGLVWEEFEVNYRELIEARDRGEEPNDPVVLLGLIAVAVWQRNPSWKRERVVRFIEQVDMSSLASVGPPEAEAAVVPPADGVALESPNGSANSKGDASTQETIQPAPGHRLSAVSTD